MRRRRLDRDQAPARHTQWGDDRLFVPTWWERHLPWWNDVLAALDTQPLTRVAGRAYGPFRRAIEAVSIPLSGLVANMGSAGRGALAALDRLATGTLRAIPLPYRIRDFLWLEPFSADNPTIPSAQAKLHRRQRQIWPWARIAAIAIHVLVIVLWPSVPLEVIEVGAGESIALEAPPQIEIPPPPQSIQRPATPVIATADISENITIAPTTFEDNPVQELPPPPTEEVVERRAGPTFTPFTVAPRILNSDEVEAHLIAEYPPQLRDAGVGASIMMWIYIDDQGGIVELRIARGSGYEMLDAAAFRVAERIRFAPALNRDENVAVWVQFPIVFTVN